MSKKKIIENLNQQINDINQILEKIKTFSSNKDEDTTLFLQILEEEVISGMHEINEILLYINSSLDNLK